MSLNQLLVWVFVGSIAGILADALVKGIRLGFVGSVVAGIAGALVSGWLFGQLHISAAGGWLDDILSSFIGPVVFLFPLRAVSRE